MKQSAVRTATQTDLDTRLRNIYYSPAGYWKGNSAVKQLANRAGVSLSVSKSFLEKQPIWQIYRNPPKHIPRPHLTISVPNEVHQADILFLPPDRFGKKIYKYALTVVDVASRYKEAEPLTSKNSKEVTDAFERIYDRSPLKPPSLLQVDPGREFFGATTKWSQKKSIKIRRGNPRIHRDQSIVERFNRTLGERLFSYNYAQDLPEPETDILIEKITPYLFNNRELAESFVESLSEERAVRLEALDIFKYDPNKLGKTEKTRLTGLLQLIDATPRFHRGFLRKDFKVRKPELEKVAKMTAALKDRWVERLPSVVNELNNTVTRLIKMKPSEAIKLKKVPQFKKNYGSRLVGKREPVIPNNTLVRYLYFPGEVEGGERRRATDPIWSLDVYSIADSQVEDNQPVIYWLKKSNQTEGTQAAPKRSFVREELQIIKTI